MIRVGIDVGGTHTDAVLMDAHHVVSKTKVATTPDVASGVAQALQNVIKDSGKQASQLVAVMIGTTQFTNALIERKHLHPVGVIRIAAPSTRSIMPTTDWPQDMQAALKVSSHIVTGGHEFDGQAQAMLDESEIERCLQDFQRQGIQLVAVTGAFSPLNPDHEINTLALISRKFPHLSVVASHKMGRFGLLERENAAILNASLRPLAAQVVGAFEAALLAQNIKAPLFLTQNDGTLMSGQEAKENPILTIASGPTNSMRGAAYLSKLSDAIVVDIGGTTSDVGILRSGLPRQSGVAIEVGGVRTNFRMPDLLSIGLGGGSLVSIDRDRCTSVGPKSTGHRLWQEAKIFGGTVLTATDIAVASGRVAIGDPKRVANLSSASVDSALRVIEQAVADAVDRIRTSPEPVPVVVVGGGAILLTSKLGEFNLIRPEHHDVANAIGAAMSQVSGEASRVVSLDQVSREQAIAETTTMAEQMAVAKGADATTLVCHDIEDVPLAYMPGQMSRIRVKVIGELTSIKSQLP